LLLQQTHCHKVTLHMPNNRTRYGATLAALQSPALARAIYPGPTLGSRCRTLALALARWGSGAAALYSGSLAGGGLGTLLAGAPWPALARTLGTFGLGYALGVAVALGALALALAPRRSYRMARGGR
jgi:hypothetical protein